MAKKFDVAAVVKESLGDVRVSEVDTVRTIPAAEIIPNPKNFYELSDLDDLAASIEQNGLIDPLIVKRMEDGRYMILSGHRRFAAMTEILGKTEFSCLIRQPVSDVYEELMLIEANRTQRKMSAADLSKQAERYTELLVQLKEAGVAIPGRLRDRVAEALQVSSTKLARLHAIRENCVQDVLKDFDAGNLNESVAYEYSRLPKTTQITAHDAGLNTVEAVQDYRLRMEAWDADPNPDPDVPPPAPKPPKGEVRTLFSAEDYLQAREEEDLKYFDLLRHVADRFLPLLTAGESRQDGIEDLKETYRYRGFTDSACYADGSGRGLTLTCPGFKVLRTWTEVYDMLCIIALRRAAEALKAKANPRSESDQKPAGLEWHRTAPDCMPPTDRTVILWAKGQLRNTPQNLIADTIRLLPDHAEYWAVVEGPEEEET